MVKADIQYYIERVKAGDFRAFSHIVSEYQKMIFTIVFKIIDNREDAEDITQEIFIKVFKSLDSFKEESGFSTWLYRIAYNTTLSEIRKRKIVFASFDNDFSNLEDEEINENIENFATEERILYLEQALKTLPAEDALLITMFYLDNQSIDEISRISDLSQANVKVKLHRIRKKLAMEINKLMAE
jgi:RNA polymerase sigma-70 factor (ECF subfamily)